VSRAKGARLPSAELFAFFRVKILVILLLMTGDIECVIKRRMNLGVSLSDNDNVVNIKKEKNPSELMKTEAVPMEEVKKQKRAVKPITKKAKIKASAAARLEYKTKFILAFRYRNVFKCILRNMHAFTESQKPKLMQSLLKEGFSETSILEAFDEIRQFKLANAIIRKPKIKIDEILSCKTPKTYIFRETIKSALQKLETGELRQVLQSNRPIYIEAFNNFLLKANEILK
jgi:uncharacterized short protein YbdD (DUF466 family)